MRALTLTCLRKLLEANHIHFESIWTNGSVVDPDW